MTDSAPFLAGMATEDISVFEPGYCMWGFGVADNEPARVAVPLAARVLYVRCEATQTRLVYVCCDLGMIGEALRQEVFVRLAVLGIPLDESELMLTATHTHSGPSGFSTYLYYALSGPGFSRMVFDELADRITRAIQRAIAAAEPATLTAHSGSVPTTEPLAWNRAPDAYSRNPEVARVSWEARASAVDRTMSVLRVDRISGRPMGLVAFFGVHATSVHAHSRTLHADHKGCAARDVEAHAKREGCDDYVAIFAQGASGDVTPNCRYSKARGVFVGPLDDDHANAEMLGAIQARYARQIARDALTDGTPLRRLSLAFRYTDFHHAEASSAFLRPGDAADTGAPQLGLAFAYGTEEGHGPLFPLRRVLARLAERSAPLRSRSVHWPKLPMCSLHQDSTLRRWAQTASAKTWARPRDPFVDYLLASLRLPAAESRPWVPRHLPGHVVSFASHEADSAFVLAGLPCEPTTASAMRLRGAIARRTRAKHIVVQGYTNAYASYLTTPEEYDAQGYESATVLFGRASLPVWCTVFDELAAGLRTDPRGQKVRGSAPERVVPEDVLPGLFQRKTPRTLRA